MRQIYLLRASAFTLGSMAILLYLINSADALNLTLVSNTDRCIYDAKLIKDRCNSVYELDPLKDPIGIYSPAKASFLFRSATKPLFSASISGLEYTLQVQNKAGKYIINISALKNPFQDVDNVFCYDGDCDYSKAWWSSSYKYRYPLNVTNQYPFTVSGGNYSQIEIPATDNCDSQGRDVELILNDTTKMRLKNVTSWNSASNTTIMFMLQSSLAAGKSDNSSYVFYCGNPADDVIYIDVELNASIDGREFKDILAGAAAGSAASTWIYHVNGTAWNINYDSPAYGAYTYENPSDPIHILFKKISNLRLEYVVWAAHHDGGNNGYGHFLINGKELASGNAPNTENWEKIGSFVFGSNDNFTTHSVNGGGYYLENVFVTTNMANTTPTFWPKGYENSSTYILMGSAAPLEEYPAAIINYTVPITISFCTNDNYLFKRILAANGSGTFEYQEYCPYGCANSTFSEWGNPGCKEAYYIEPLIALIFLIIMVLAVKWVVS